MVAPVAKDLMNSRGRVKVKPSEADFQEKKIDAILNHLNRNANVETKILKESFFAERLIVVRNYSD